MPTGPSDGERARTRADMDAREAAEAMRRGMVEDIAGAVRRGANESNDCHEGRSGVGGLSSPRSEDSAHASTPPAGLARCGP